MVWKQKDDKTDLRDVRLSSREKHSHALLPLLLMGGDYLAVLLAEAMALYLRRFLPWLPSPDFNIPNIYLHTQTSHMKNISKSFLM